MGNSWYTIFSEGHTHVSTAGLPSFMPIRANVAVPDIELVESWYESNVPSMRFTRGAGGGPSSTCRTLTTTLGAYTAPQFELEVRYVENAAAQTSGFTVSDFVKYIGEVN